MAIYDKVCKACGKKFKAVNYRSAYCSNLCRSAAAAKRCAEHYAREHKKDKEKVCRGCGKEFKAANSLQQYCDECRAKKYLKNERHCKICGKPLLYKQRSYCSEKCRDAGTVKQVLRSGTLCWNCKWATGKEGRCPWARSLTPVDGWGAKKVKLKVSATDYTDSYIVKECPLFEEG